MAEANDKPPTKPDSGAKDSYMDEGRPTAKKLPYLLLLVLPVIMMLQGILGLISDKTGFLSSQVVQQLGFLVFMLVGAPIMAIVGWQYLIGDSNLRYHWEARVLAVSAIIVIVGFDVFAVTDLVTPTLLPKTFSLALLYVTVTAFALLVFSALVMLVRVGLSASANRRQARTCGG